MVPVSQNTEKSKEAISRMAAGIRLSFNASKASKVKRRKKFIEATEDTLERTEQSLYKWFI